MATDLHKFLERRGMAWLYTKGFRWCATEVPIGWTEGKKRTSAHRIYNENADALGVGIIGMDARSCCIEVKVSRGDFLGDFNKFHRLADNPHVTERYYLAPAGMLKPEEMPERWGLLEYHAAEDKILVAKRAKRRLLAHLVKKPPKHSPWHGNTPPWKIPLEADVVGGVAMWGNAWAAVAERMANDYRFRHVGLHPKKRRGEEYTVDRENGDV